MACNLTLFEREEKLHDSVYYDRIMGNIFIVLEATKESNTFRFARIGVHDGSFFVGELDQSFVWFNV